MSATENSSSSSVLAKPGKRTKSVFQKIKEKKNDKRIVFSVRKKNLFGYLVPRGESLPSNLVTSSKWWTLGSKGSLEISQLDLSHALESPPHFLGPTVLGVIFLKLSSMNPFLGQPLGRNPSRLCAVTSRYISAETKRE